MDIVLFCDLNVAFSVSGIVAALSVVLILLGVIVTVCFMSWVRLVINYVSTVCTRTRVYICKVNRWIFFPIVRSYASVSAQLHITAIVCKH